MYWSLRLLGAARHCSKESHTLGGVLVRTWVGNAWFGSVGALDLDFSEQDGSVRRIKALGVHMN